MSHLSAPEPVFFPNSCWSESLFSSHMGPMLENFFSEFSYVSFLEICCFSSRGSAEQPQAKDCCDLQTTCTSTQRMQSSSHFQSMASGTDPVLIQNFSWIILRKKKEKGKASLTFLVFPKIGFLVCVT